jgi:hypothetical protein
MKPDMTELTVVGISLDRNTENPRIILRSKDGFLTGSLSIGSFEAHAIIVEIKKVKLSEPLTHDTFAQFLTRHGFRMEHLLLHSFSDDSCLADLVYRKGLKHYAAGIRPSDGIALAVRLGAPLFILSHERALWNDARVRFCSDGGEERDILYLGTPDWQTTHLQG